MEFASEILKFPPPLLKENGSCEFCMKTAKSHTCRCSSSSCINWTALRQKQLQRRKDLKLLRHPLKTLSYFLLSASSFLIFSLKYVFSHALTLVLLSVCSLLLVSARIDGPHSQGIQELWLNTSYFIWWIGLGILSSIGLGSGMHSGLLFLFPHIYFICSTAERCHSVSFDTRQNMWNNVMKPGDHFICSSASNMTDITFWDLVLKCLPAAFIWGLGTAVGELPPYAASYAAAKSKLADEEFEGLEAEIKTGNPSLITKMKMWMLELVRKWGALSVFLLSCWPNVLFDLCGIVCGHFMMPFWEFFLSLVLGKAIVKTIFQVAFFVFLFASKFDAMRAHFIGIVANIFPFNILLGSIFGSTEKFEDFILKEINAFRSGIENPAVVSKATGFSVSSIFSYIVLLFVSLFFLSCVEQFAQMYVKKRDERKNEKLILYLDQSKKNT